MKLEELTHCCPGASLLEDVSRRSFIAGLAAAATGAQAQSVVTNSEDEARSYFTERFTAKCKEALVLFEECNRAARKVKYKELPFECEMAVKFHKEEISPFMRNADETQLILLKNSKEFTVAFQKLDAEVQKTKRNVSRF